MLSTVSRRLVCSGVRKLVLQLMGAPASAGKSRGLTNFLIKKIKVNCPYPDFLKCHGFIHHENLCKEALDFKHVTNPMIVLPITFKYYLRLVKQGIKIFCTRTVSVG